MKRVLLLATVLLASTFANADHTEWHTELENYRETIQTASNTNLWVRDAFYVTAALTTCSLSAATTGAAYLADTAPVTGVLAELIANGTVPGYVSYEAWWSWEMLAQTGRGFVGGGVVTLVETLEFLTLWLGGNEEQSFEALRKTYASTFATAETVFAEQGRCMMSISRMMITRAELQERGLIPEPNEIPPIIAP